MVGDIYRHQWYWQIGNRVVNSQFHLREVFACTDAWPEETVSRVVETKITPEIRTLQSSEVRLLWTYTRKVTYPAGIPRERVFSEFSLWTGEPLPSTTHAIFNLHGPYADEWRSGWLRIPGVSEELQKSGSLTGFFSASANNLRNQLIAVLTATAPRTGQFRGTHFTHPFNPNPVYTICHLRSSMGSKRNRRQRPHLA